MAPSSSCPDRYGTVATFVVGSIRMTRPRPASIDPQRPVAGEHHVDRIGAGEFGGQVGHGRRLGQARDREDRVEAAVDAAPQRVQRGVGHPRVGGAAHGRQRAFQEALGARRVAVDEVAPVHALLDRGRARPSASLIAVAGHRGAQDRIGRARRSGGSRRWRPPPAWRPRRRSRAARDAGGGPPRAGRCAGWSSGSGRGGAGTKARSMFTPTSSARPAAAWAASIASPQRCRKCPIASASGTGLRSGRPASSSCGRTGSRWCVAVVAATSTSSIASIPSEPTPPRISKSWWRCSTAARGEASRGRSAAPRCRPPARRCATPAPVGRRATARPPRCRAGSPAPRRASRRRGDAARSGSSSSTEGGGGSSNSGRRGRSPRRRGRAWPRGPRARARRAPPR